MHAVIGLNTKKVYAEGLHSECLRKLNDQYPYGDGTYLETSSVSLYEEPLMIVRKGERQLEF